MNNLDYYVEIVNLNFLGNKYFPEKVVIHWNSFSFAELILNGHKKFFVYS